MEALKKKQKQRLVFWLEAPFSMWIARGNRRGTQLGDVIRGRQSAGGGRSEDYTVATTGDKRIQESERASGKGSAQKGITSAHTQTVPSCFPFFFPNILSTQSPSSGDGRKNATLARLFLQR